jgi:outer membrane protein assembly factor BamE (lipoprotein component of BamABCDE complex)
MRFTSVLKALMAIGCGVVLVACSPKVAQRGHVDLQEKLEQIKTGESHKQDVIRLLGSPSTTSNFGDETWYYIQARQEAVSFFRPEVVDQKTFRITFNESGMVSKTEEFTQEDGRDIATVDDITLTEGHKLGFWEQILGNLGKFNKAPEEAR